MSQSLLDLIKAYGDARADWAERCSHRHVNRVPEALAAVEARINWAARMIRKAGQGAGRFEAATYLSSAIEALDGTE